MTMRQEPRQNTIPVFRSGSGRYGCHRPSGRLVERTQDRRGASGDGVCHLGRQPAEFWRQMAEAADQHRALAMLQRVAFGLGDRAGLKRFGRRGLRRRVGHQRERLLPGGLGVRGSPAFAPLGLGAVQSRAEVAPDASCWRTARRISARRRDRWDRGGRGERNPAPGHWPRYKGRPGSLRRRWRGAARRRARSPRVPAGPRPPGCRWPARGGSCAAYRRARGRWNWEGRRPGWGCAARPFA